VWLFQKEREREKINKNKQEQMGPQKELFFNL
jgi:hypothetical protein